MGDGTRLPGRPKSPEVKKVKATFERQDQVGEGINPHRISRDFEAIRLVMGEQGRAGRQMATTARASYEEDGETKSIVGPQMMVTFGEGLFFIMKEACEVLDKLRQSVEANERLDKEQIRYWQRRTADLEEELDDLKYTYVMMEFAIELLDKELSKKGKKRSIENIIEEAQALRDEKLEQEDEKQERLGFGGDEA